MMKRSTLLLSFLFLILALQIQNAKAQNKLLPLNKEWEIAENQPASSVLFELSVENDTKQEYTFAITYSNVYPTQVFIDGNKLLTKYKYNYESISVVIQFAITATGPLGEKITNNYNFKIIDVEEPPIYLQINNGTIAENSDENTEVGTLVAYGDNYDVLTYTMPDNDYFKIVDNKLIVRGNLNYEKQSSHYLPITVTDQIGLTDFRNFIIQVEDINEAPTAISLSNTTIAENSAIGTEVGTLTASDVDASQTFTYTIAENTNFDIVGDKLVSKVAFDFETQDTYSIELTVADQGGLTHKQSFSIDITDANEAPTAIALSNATIIENSAIGTEVGTLSASDIDADQTFTYTIVENESFEIAGDKLISKVAFDFEKKDSYAIDIKVEDQDGLSFTQDFIISIDNVLEIFPEQTEHDFIEAQAKGAELFELTVDGGNSEFQFEIVKSNWSPAPWEIVNNKLVSKYSISAETVPTSPWIVTIQASDNKGIFLTKDYSVQVIDIPEAPVFYTTYYNLYFEENKTIGSEVGVVKTSNDRGDIVSFSIDDNDFFEIQPGESSADGRFHEAIIISKGVFDFEKTTSYNLEVTATDQLGLFTKQIHTINIKDENDAPSAISLSNVTINENSAIGSEVGTLTASDEDANQAFTYTIAENENFEIVSDKLVSKSDFDFETQDTYSVELTVADQDGLTYKQSFSIDITDENEAPTAISLSNATISENSAFGIEVGTLTASDFDANQTFTYTIVENENFEIVSDKLVSKSDFDFETQDTYSVELTVADQDGLTYKQSFDIQITDTNDAPNEIQLSNATIAENSAIGTELGTLTASDVDASQTFTYTIAENGNFEIAGDKLVSKASFDFETLDNYSVEITVTDQDDLSHIQSLTIQVVDANEDPTAIQLSANTIAENSVVGTEIGTLIASDVDANQTFIYTIVDENFEIVGDKLVSKSDLDFETKNSYSVEITVADQDGLSHKQSFSIQITDVNDAPSAIQLSNAAITENSAIGTEVGTLTASDVDAGQTFTYTIAENKNFEIAGDKLLSKAVFDFETLDNYSVEIIVADQDGLSHKQSFSINVTDENDIAPVITVEQVFYVKENSLQGTLVAIIEVTDGDKTPTSLFTFSWAGGNTNSAFVLDPGTGEIRINNPGAIDSEANSRFDLVFTASDGVNTSKEETLIILIDDINEFSPIVSTSTFLVDENVENNVLVGQVLANDNDVSATFTDWTITSGNEDAIFSINTASGEISIADNTKLDFETTISYTLSVTVSDGINTSSAETVSINVIDINEAPTAIQLSNATIAENSAIGTEVGILTASDEDASQELTFSLAENGFFALDGDKLVSKSTFNYEANNSYSVEITVTDQGGLNYKQSFTIQISDVNEAPIAIQLSNTTIAENSAIGTEVGILTASDEDANQTLTFTIDENQFFELDGNKLVTKRTFNFETLDSPSVDVIVTDQGGLPHMQGFAIQITDVNEAPIFISDPFVDAILNERYTYMIEYQDVDADGCIVTAFEMPSWLNLEDNGDGTATLYGTPTEAGTFNVILEASDNEYTARQEFELVVETVTGIEDVLIEPIVRIYPNPVANELHINLSDLRNDETTISLFSMTGSLIFKEEHQSIRGEVRIIKSVQQLRSGTYLLVIESEDYRKIFKIVKQ